MAAKNGTLAVWEKLKPLIDAEIAQQTRSCCRMVQMVVATPYNAETKTVGVQEAFGDIINIPVSGSVDTSKLEKGTSVWVVVPFSSYSNAVVLMLGDGDTGYAANAGELGGKEPAYYSRPHNWLNNGNFCVNQRGQTEYTAQGMCVDRWRFRTPETGGSLQVMPVGVRINMKGDGDVYGLYQRVASTDYLEVFERLKGKPITLAVKIAGSTVSSTNCGIDLLDSKYLVTEGTGAVVIARTNFPAQTTGIVVANGVMPEEIVNEGILALIRTRAGSAEGHIDVEWMALYEGTYTADDLPEFVPPLFSSELLECQRFYFRTDGQGWGYCVSSTAARLNIVVPTQMIWLPSIEDPSVTITCQGNGSYFTASDAVVANLGSNKIRLNLTSSEGDFVKNTVIAGYGSNPIGLSADL